MDQIDQEAMLNNIKQNAISLNNTFNSMPSYELANNSDQLSQVVAAGSFNNSNVYDSTIEAPSNLATTASQHHPSLMLPIQIDNLSDESVKISQSENNSFDFLNRNICNKQNSEPPCVKVSNQLPQNSKKLNKKKTSQTSSDLDEERTSQLVSEILKNIKEKTKQLESMNQTIKNTNNSNSSDQSSNLNKSSNNKFNLLETQNFDDTTTKSFISSSNTNSPANSNSNDIMMGFDDSNSVYHNNINNNSNNLDTSFNSSSIQPSLTNKLNKKTKNSSLTRKSNNDQAKPNRTGNKKPKIKSIEESKSKPTKNNYKYKTPIGWTRSIEEFGNTSNKLVSYSSPSGFKMYSLQDVRIYLLSANTCKCGLECPLMIGETFCFDPKIEIPNNQNNNITFSCCKHRAKPLNTSSTNLLKPVVDSVSKMPLMTHHSNNNYNNNQTNENSVIFKPIIELNTSQHMVQNYMPNTNYVNTNNNNKNNDFHNNNGKIIVIF